MKPDRNKETKKTFVLTKLQALSLPVTMPELLPHLPEEYSERSVRRWLNELVGVGLVIKTGHKKGTRYQAAIRGDSPFGVNSQQVLAYVNQPLFKRRPVAYQRDWLEDYQPNESYYLSVSQREQLAVQGQDKFVQDPAGTYARSIYNRLLIDLSYNSSRLEGNTYSLVETQKLVLEGVPSEGKLNEEKIMILNHKEAIRYLVDNAHKLTLNYDVICTLHYLLSDGLVPVGMSGTVRDHGVRISSSVYVPLEHPLELERQLTRVVEKANHIADPYEQSFFLLVHIAYLQAFTDVNKRTSRLSANIPLIRSNLIPLSFNDIRQDDYIAAMLSVYECNDTSPLADLYCLSYNRTCSEYKAIEQNFSFDETRIRFRTERRTLLRQIISEDLHGDTLDKMVHHFIDTRIPLAHQNQFKKNVYEDLRSLTPSRIVGLGVTEEQLRAWVLKDNSSS